MALSDIFLKPIDRPIEGVIKADDEQHLRQEVEEYVLTNEIAKRLDHFLSAYNDYHEANGVWISGFFGSGKSHLLKMLALLFDHRQLDGTSVLDLFTPKLADNTFLRADLERALRIPSTGILFNIDQKADVISKTELDALLAVFVKVFDEMQGYYGKQGYIATFERDLDSRNQYEAFKQAFQQKSGIDWELGREQALLESHNIDAAYAEVTGMPLENARGILDKYRDDYKVSIEDFAEDVDAYIQRQGEEFRLLFFVDEVGQYIADNVKLMTNLQTVAESLATKCQGRAWLVVTAQEDMDQVFGDASKQQSEDFSKIQDRFKTRMKLTSADVEEVIRIRLLAKNDSGTRQLKRIYEQEKNNFRTLFGFTDGSQTYRTFNDEEHFIQSYPFIPYQYTLFQSAIQSLSAHNAFEGKHSSVGARSMLGVFQDVAVQIRGHRIGQLATFDLMFEGIRAALKTQVQQAVITAENHLENAFAVRLLKALFLVKYVKAFKATVRNLTVLMIEDFNTNLPELKQRVEQALSLLEQQTYIQRTAEEYEYLTDEEKDIEQEIKNTVVERSAVEEELGKLVFDDVIRDRKIRYDENDKDYAFGRKLDDRLLGRDYELTIHVVSPYHEHAGNDTVLISQAMGRDELLVLLPLNARLMNDLLLYKQTEKYTLLHVNTAQQASVRRILMDKQLQNTTRMASLRMLVSDLMRDAVLVVDGRDLDIAPGDPRTRIQRGFNALVSRTYPNLRMLRGIAYTEANIPRLLNPQSSLLGDDPATYSEAEQDMLAFVQMNKTQGVRTSLQSLISTYERKPYGWYLAAIQCLTAKLIGRGKLELNRDGTILEDDELVHALTNTHGYANVVLEHQAPPPEVSVRWLRDFNADFFDEPVGPLEYKALARETSRRFSIMVQDLNALTGQSVRYPFLTALREPNEQLQALCGKPYTYYYEELRDQENVLFDMKEQVIAPIRRFMSGNQREIFDDARRFLDAHRANFPYLENTDAVQLQQLINDPNIYTGNRMQEVKILLNNLSEQVEKHIQEEKENITAQINRKWDMLIITSEFNQLDQSQQASLRKPFDDLLETIHQQNLIPMMRDSLNRFMDTSYTSVLHRMTSWIQQKSSENDGTNKCKEKKAEYITRSSIKVDYQNLWLESEEDVDRYLKALKQAFSAVIKEGKRIQL